MRGGGRRGKVKDLVDASGGLQGREIAGCLFLLATYRVHCPGVALQRATLFQGGALLAVIDQRQACLWQVEQARQRVRATKWPGTDTAPQMKTGRHARHSGR